MLDRRRWPEMGREATARAGSTVADLPSLAARFSDLAIAYRESPPFRPLDQGEERTVARTIGASGARILFVGLGRPKQERWMARQIGGIGAVMLGVGTAFDFVSGTKRQAPPVLQRAGLEWGFRLVQEPRRLWRRYLYHNPRFVALFLDQLVRGRLEDVAGRAGIR